MAKRVILMKYGELILKGANKFVFEDLLLKNIKKRLVPLERYEVRVMQSTVYITPDDDSLTEDTFEALRTVFGIASMCIAYQCEKNLDDILRVIRESVVPELDGVKSFRADARRSDKSFPLTSPELSAEAGGAVLSLRPDIKVDLYHPEVTLMVEVRDRAAFVHATTVKGAGGMPYTSSGKALLLLSGGIDSPVAGYMMARRGAQIEALHFESYPYTSERALEKVMNLGRHLCRYTDTLHVTVISLTELQLEIKKKCNEEYFTLILRRFMMRLANLIAARHSCLALVTGESLAQVASQTMPALAVTDSVAETPVLRPLIGMDKNDIVEIARSIDTFETSILPYEDCCTVFTPRHPKLRPVEAKVEAEEAKLDIDALLNQALATLREENLTCRR